MRVLGLWMAVLAALTLAAACGGEESAPTPTVTATPTASAQRATPTTTAMSAAAVGKIAFTRGGEPYIYVVSTDGSGLTRPSAPGAVVLPTWSPDGARLAFVSVQGDDYGLYNLRSDGTGLIRLTDVAGQEYPFPPVWSPDGRRIAFELALERELGGNVDIFVIGSDGSGRANLTNNPAVDGAPSWSPDSKRIAFQSSRDGNSDIYVVNADGSGLTNVTRHPARDSSPAWSPDGQRLAFFSDRDGTSELYVMNADGSGLMNLSKSPGAEFALPVGHLPPVWSPDSNRIAFVSDRDGNSEIYVATADGTRQAKLTDNPADDVLPTWSPDGERIAFQSNRDGRLNIYAVNSDGSGLVQLTRDGGSFPVWQSTGRR